MGRRRTGAETCENSLRIELSFLLKLGHFKKWKSKTEYLSWTSGASITLTSYTNSDEKWIRLKYTITDYWTKEEIPCDYKIYLTSLPSNLGKGEVLYFICPSTKKRCRILYSAYGYHHWLSRRACSKRLYYSSQLFSKKSYANERYFALVRQFDSILDKEKLTAQDYSQLEKLEPKIEYWDEVRWEKFLSSQFIRKIWDEFEDKL